MGKNSRASGLKNPTKEQKRAYKEKQQRGQGMDLDKLTEAEIKIRNHKDFHSVERKEERRLDGSSGYEYLGNDKDGLGSPTQYDDHSSESRP